MRLCWIPGETPDGRDRASTPWDDLVVPEPEPLEAGLKTYAVTLVQPGPGLPCVEVGAYRYMGKELPRVGDTIPVTPEVFGGRALVGYVTRVHEESKSPISVVEVEGDVNADELILPSTGMHCAEDDAHQAA
jgi:hypothetical protein